MSRDNENKIKKFLNDLRIFEAELNIILELQKEADSLMRAPGTWKMIRREAGERYADALNRSLVFIGKVNTAFSDLDIEDMREDLRDIEDEQQNLVKDNKLLKEETKLEEKTDKTEKQIKNEELINLSDEEKRKIYMNITGTSGKKHSSTIALYVKKYNRITIYSLIDEMGQKIIKNKENKGDNLTQSIQVKNSENKDILADEDIPTEN